MQDESEHKSIIRKMNQPIWLWVFAALTATLQFAILYATSYMHFLSDDIAISRVFMGYWGGVPSAFNLYTYPGLAYPLQWLSVVFPAVHWFAMMQLAFLWFSCTLAGKALMQIAQRLRWPTWVGLGLYLLFSYAFIIEHCTTVTYTFAVAIMTAAAIFQLYATNLHSPARTAKGLALSLVPVFLGFMLRDSAALPAILFWTCGLLLRMLTTKPFPGRKCIIAAIKVIIAVSLCFGLMLGFRAMEIQKPENKDYIQWQNSRIRMIDYTYLYAFSLEDFENLGLSEADHILYENIYLWESSISKDVLDSLNVRYREITVDWESQGILSKLKSAFVFNDQRLLEFGLWWKIIGLLALLALTLPITNAKKELLAYAAPICMAGLITGMFIYLVMQGRYPLHAVATFAFPGTAALLCLAFENTPHKLNWRTSMAMAIAVPCLFFVLRTAKTAYRFYTNPRTDWHQEIYPNECAAYVNRNPDQLFWGAPEVINEYNALYINTTTTRNLLPLTSWNVRSPEKNAVLVSFELDPGNFSYSVLLHENQRVITKDEAPPDILLKVLSLHAKAQVNAELIDEYQGFRIFRFVVTPDS